MAAEYSRGLLKVCVAQLCQNLGWNAIQSSPLELMTDVLERYLTDLGKTTQRYCEQFGRLDPNLDDLGLAFFHLGIPLGELEEYVRHLDPVLFAHDVISFPVQKTSNFQFPNQKSREIQQEREEHIPDHLPYMFPGMEGVPGEQDQTPSHPPEETVTSQDDKGISAEVSPVATGEKRAVSSPGDGLPSKRMRLSSSNLPEEAGHSQYEMMSVTMSQSGHLTPTRGQGKLPDASTPPPGLCQPISSVEPDKRKKDADKERDRNKTKDKHKKNLVRSEGDRHGLPLKSSHPNEKENLSDSVKSRLKPGLMKTFDAKKFAKKDGGKRSGLLKSYKFGKPIFKTKSKNLGNSSSIQEMLFSDPLNMVSQADGKAKSDKDKLKFKKKHSVDSSKHPELERLMLGGGDGVKSVKSTDTESERERVALPGAMTMVDSSDDSDDELSEDDSPVRRLVIADVDHTPRDTEMRKKERLQRIDDILDSVIKSSKAESDDSSSFSEAVETAKEVTPNFVPKSKSKEKEKEKVKLKPNSSKNTSSLDLDACINTVVRQSAEESSKKDIDTTCTSEKDTCSDRPKIVSPTSGNKKQKIKKKLKTKPGKQVKGFNKVHVREQLKEKIKSRSISQDSSGVESENSAKPEKVYPPQFGVFDFPPDSPEKSVPLAPLHPPAAPLTQQVDSPVHKPSPVRPASPEEREKSEEKIEVTTDSKPGEFVPSVEPLKLEISKEKTKHKERSKEKEHKKDRKDKKKDKEKKKKNKDKDREKSKDRDKKEKHRDKHDREDKNEGSVPMTIPKLKLKIGGISVGGGSSKSVTITNTPVPKDNTPSPDEIKSAPIRPEIPRLVIKPVPRRPATESPAKPVMSPPPVKPSPPTPARPAPPPGFKAIPESAPVPSPVETNVSLSKPPSAILSPTKTAPAQPHKEDHPKPSPPKPLPPPTPPMLPKFRPIPPVSSSPPPVRNIISPPSPPPPTPPPPPLKEEVPPASVPSPKISSSPSPPPKTKSPSPPPPKPEPPKSPEKPKSPLAPPIFYPAPPRRTASLSPRSRELPLYSNPPPKRKNSSPRGRKPASPGRSTATPPKRKASTTSPGRKKGSPKGPKKKPVLTAVGKGNLSSPPPSTFAREEEHPSFAPAKPSVKSSQSFSKEETPSPAPSPPTSPSPSPSPNPKSEQTGLPPPPPPSKPQPLQRAVFAETVGTSAVSSWDETGQRIWICPTCKLADDGSPMIGCDRCDEWYHWPCVSILEPPPEDEDWFCPKCKALQAKVKGKGKGAKRGRKKKVK